MSRLFEGFGDGADDVKLPEKVNPSEHDLAALPKTEERSLLDGAPLSADESSSLLDETSSLLDDAGIGVGHGLHVEPADDDIVEEAAEPDPLPTQAEKPYHIPDFEQEARDTNAYDDAKRRHLRQQLAAGETAVHASFSAKREQLQREIATHRSFDEERRQTAITTTRKYANAYPQHVDRKGVKPPTFMENLFSFGRAGRLYRAAAIAAEALETLRTTLRRREEALTALESQLKRALTLKEDMIKKAVESPEGMAEFHERPEIAPLYKKLEAIREERLRYASRLARGAVTDEEQRDRSMAENKIAFAELPMMGAIIARVARYGNLNYFQLKTLEKKEYLLSYDPRIDPLRNSVFDVYNIAGEVTAKLRRNESGTAFRVADHFKVCWRNQDKAEELYGQHRAALREDRGLPTLEPRNETEAEIIEALAVLAATIEGSQGPS